MGRSPHRVGADGPLWPWDEKGGLPPGSRLDLPPLSADMGSWGDADFGRGSEGLCFSRISTTRQARGVLFFNQSTTLRFKSFICFYALMKVQGRKVISWSGSSKKALTSHWSFGWTQMNFRSSSVCTGADGPAPFDGGGSRGVLLLQRSLMLRWRRTRSILFDPCS